MASDKSTLTENAVASLVWNENGPPRQVRWDGKLRGFGCRVTPAGGKQYVLSYRFNGRPRLMSLGRIENFTTVRDAREKASAYLHGLNHDGIDPMSSREQLAESSTIEELWKDFDTQVLANRSHNSQRAMRSMFRKHVLPRVGTLKPSQLTKSDVVRLHDYVTSHGGKVIANRAVQRLSGLLNWAHDRSERSFPRDWRNPCKGVKLHTEHARKHILTVEQLRLLMAALDLEDNPHIRGCLLLILLTGARQGEIRALKWKDVNLQAGFALLGQTKSGEDRFLQLSPMAVQVLQSLPVMAGTEYVFPGRPITQPLAAPYVPFKDALKRAGLPNTTLHDLRRSFGTNLARMGASSGVVAAALGNTTEVAARVYVQIAGQVVKDLALQHATSLLPVPMEKIAAQESSGTPVI